VIAVEVEPGVGQVDDAQASQVAGREVAHERRHRLAVETFGDVALAEWYAGTAEPFAIREVDRPDGKAHAFPVRLHLREGCPVGLVPARVAGHADVEVDLAELGVAAGAVVALAVVLEDELPVGRHLVVLAEADPGAVQAVPLDERLDRAAGRAEVGRFLGEADVDKAGDFFEMSRVERVGGPVKVIAHPASRSEPAVPLVDPLVIRTNEFTAMTLVLRADARAP